MKSLIDWADFPSFSFGLDRMLDDLQRFVDQPMPAKFPPYNIRKVADTKFVLDIAVAGYGEDQLKVSHDRMKHRLVIMGLKDRSEDDQLVFSNMAGRDFKLSFFLAPHFEVAGTALKNGMLRIFIEQIIPEELKPRDVAIGHEAPANFLPAPEEGARDSLESGVKAAA